MLRRGFHVNQLPRSHRSHEYAYDAISQLVNVQEEETRKAAYVFDPAGNRLIKETPNAVLHYTHDAANEMNTADETSFGYDKNGNMIRMLEPSENKPTLFHYDYAGRLMKVELPDGRTAEYNHNGDGHRMYKVVPGEGATIYYWDPGVISGISQVLNEVDVDDNPIADYFFGRGIVPLGIKVGGEYRYYLTDIQGSILVLIDDDGVITDRYEYDEYGAQTRLFGTFPNPLGYTGQYHDEETGFIYLRNRYYEPEIGRFISRDPIGIAGNVNFYVYCANNPYLHTDALGLIEGDIGIYLLIGGAVLSFLIPASIPASMIALQVMNIVRIAGYVLMGAGATVLLVLQKHIGQNTTTITKELKDRKTLFNEIMNSLEPPCPNPNPK